MTKCINRDRDKARERKRRTKKHKEKKSRREGETEKKERQKDKQSVCVGLLEMFSQKVHYAKEIPQGRFNKSLLEVCPVKYCCNF